MKRLLCLLAIVCLSMPAAATTIRRLTLEQVRDRAESIFVARVISSSPRAALRGHLPATDYVLDVTDVLYGAVPESTTITFAAIEGAPAVEIGREYVFFRTSPKNNTTVGFAQGLFSLESANVGGSERTLLISGDGEALVIRKGAVARGQRVVVHDRQIVAQTSSAHGEPMDTNARAEGAGVRRLPSRASVAKAAAPAYATLDDLKAFVRAKQVNQ